MKPWQNLTDLFDTQEVNSEMVKKYKNTHLCINTGKAEFYAVYRGYEAGYHRFKDSFEAELLISNETDCDITIPTVKQGLYNTAHGVHYVTHNPYRQYRKGLCSDRLSCVSLRDFLLGAFPDNNYSRVIYDVLQNQQKTLPIGDALNEASLMGMAAINQDYAITLSTENADGFDLYYRIYRVGSIDKNTIRVDNKLFLQEIYDTKHKWCPKHEVILNG